MRQDAIDRKHFHVVEVLNQWGAKVSFQDEGALCDAAGSGNIEQVRQLLKSGADPSRGDYDERTPLHVAAANGHHKVPPAICSVLYCVIATMVQWKAS